MQNCVSKKETGIDDNKKDNYETVPKTGAFS